MPPPGLKLSGIKNVINRLNIETRKIENNAKVGLLNAANHIRRSTETKKPLVPVDLGNLRNSWTAVIIPQLNPNKIAVRMGYSANYAFFVHESVDGHFNAPNVLTTSRWKRPGSGPKWFQIALNREQQAIVDILAAAAGKEL